MPKLKSHKRRIERAERDYYRKEAAEEKFSKLSNAHVAYKLRSLIIKRVRALRGLLRTVETACKADPKRQAAPFGSFRASARGLYHPVRYAVRELLYRDLEAHPWARRVLYNQRPPPVDALNPVHRVERGGRPAEAPAPPTDQAIDAKMRELELHWFRQMYQSDLHFQSSRENNCDH